MLRVAERIRRAIERAAIPNEGSGAQGIVAASFGVASSSVTELSSGQLIAVADNALYAAKRKGRNQVWPPLTNSCDPSAAVTSIVERQRA